MQDYVKNETSIVYLEDSSYILELENDRRIRMFGSPWTAIYGKPGKAFQIPESDLSEKWQHIPSSTDILITHMPPFGIRDVNSGKVKSGCKELSNIVLGKINPKIHVFGHIHESYGWEVHKNTTFINAASRKPKSKVLNNPILVDYYIDENKTPLIHFPPIF